MGMHHILWDIVDIFLAKNGRCLKARENVHYIWMVEPWLPVDFLTSLKSNPILSPKLVSLDDGVALSK